MTLFVTVLHALVCVVLIVVVLLQRGKGAEIGAVFGGGAGTTLFGSRGAGSFLTKLTTWAAVVFMATSFYLAYVAINSEQSGLYDADTTPAGSPAAPTPAPQQGAPAPSDFVEVPARKDASAGRAAAPDAVPPVDSSGSTRDSSRPAQ